MSVPNEASNEPNNANNPQATTTKKANLKLPILIGIGLLAVLLVVGYFYNKNSQAQTAQILTLEQATQQSDSLYHELKKELAIYKQENEELYAQIAQKESLLETQYLKIKRLIDQAKRDKDARKKIQTKLENLQTELANMEAYVEAQTLDLEELRVENRRLKKEKALLDQKYAEELAAKEALKQQEANLSNANAELNKKIQAASVLQVTNVNAKGWRLKNNGDRRGVDFAKRTELVEICFDIVPNEVCEPGVNRFFMRMLDPSGNLVQDKDRGSGQFTLFDTNEALGYTISRIFDYQPSEKKLCLEWYAYPNTPFVKGSYQIFLYNKGRQVGQYTFNTK